MPTRQTGAAGQLHDACAQLFAAIESVWPCKVLMSPLPSGACVEVACGRGPLSGPRLLTAAGAAPTSTPACRLVDLSFSNDAAVPTPFRGRVMSSLAASDPPALTLQPHERELARTARGPVWTVSSHGASTTFRSAFALAEFAPHGSFSQVFNADRFIENLPLLELLRTASTELRSQLPPLRAAFMFDDPNLHRPRYGHVRYEQIVRHADAHNYHVAFATIPLDGWYTHDATVALFRRRPDRLSLLVHGNNHTWHELARCRSSEACASLLHQALARVQRLERSTGLSVCRVMVPPHGACTDTMLTMLQRFGFDAACISAGSLLAHNGGSDWLHTLGMLPCEDVNGCMVLPRSALTGNAVNALLINAYLGQPIILRAHQQDVRDGLDRLDHLAGIVNSLGPVAWVDPTTIARMSHLSQTDDRSATRIVTARPAHVGRLSVDMVAILRRLCTEARDRLTFIRP